MKKREEVIAFLGKGTEFEGKLTFHGAIRIDGHFKGEISSDGNLIIGEEGMIEANIHVSYIVICGEIHGDIIADKRIEVHMPGKVFGNIQAPVLVMDEGVIFKGNCLMDLVEEAEERKLAASIQMT
jgi:cytoskeletal protein CcmA (bactofilin family)